MADVIDARRWSGRDFASFLLVLLACGAVAAAYSLTQTQMIYGGGYPYDASYYMAMAKEVAQGASISIERPFVYRVALPYLAGVTFPHDLLHGFLLINLIFAALTLVVLQLYVRTFTKNWWSIAGVLLLFVTNMNAPFRNTPFYPAYVDAPALFAVLLTFYLDRQWRGSSLAKLMALSAIGLFGVLFREIVAVAPLALLCAALVHKLLHRSSESRALLFYAIPLAAALFGILLTHLLVEPIDSRYSFGIAALNSAKHNLSRPDIPILALLMCYGPALALPLIYWNSVSVRFFTAHIELAVFLFLVVVLAVVGGGHTDRYYYWGFPAVMPLTALAIERLISARRSIWSMALILTLIATQIAAFRAFAQIPNQDFDVLGKPGVPSLFILAPYGQNTNSAQVAGALMANPTRAIALLEYSLLLFWMWVLCRNGGLLDEPDIKSRSGVSGRRQSLPKIPVAATLLLALAIYVELAIRMGLADPGSGQRYSYVHELRDWTAS
jgi:hypothetical protein